MNKQIIVHDLGLVDYQDALDYQLQLFNQIIDIKLKNRKNNTKNKSLDSQAPIDINNYDSSSGSQFVPKVQEKMSNSFTTKVSLIISNHPLSYFIRLHRFRDFVQQHLDLVLFKALLICMILTRATTMKLLNGTN